MIIKTTGKSFKWEIKYPTSDIKQDANITVNHIFILLKYADRLFNEPMSIKLMCEVLKKAIEIKKKGATMPTTFDSQRKEQG